LAFNVMRSVPASQEKLTLPLSTRSLRNGEIFSADFEDLMNSATASAVKLVARDYVIEDELSVESDLKERGGTTWPWFTTTYQDKVAFAFNMFTTMTTYDNTNGGNPQTYKMLVDTGSSDTWMTTPYNPANWSPVDNTNYSISYGWGPVTSLRLYSVPQMTVGSASVTNYRVGFLRTPPSFFYNISSDTAAGIFGLGASNLAALGSANSWEASCTVSGYLLSVSTQKLEICTSATGGNQFPFVAGTNRAAFAAVSSVNVGSTSVVLNPLQPMLIDTGSAYCVFDNTTAGLINAAIKAQWPLSLKRRDGDSEEYQPTEETKSRVKHLVRRQNPSQFSGPYPSHTNTLTTSFFRVNCQSGQITITLNGVAYTLPGANYVYRDTSTNICYSAFVGISASQFANMNTFSGEIASFSILGQPFIRATNINSISVNHDTKLININ